MALPIIENPLYGDIQLETTAWTTPFSWVDRTGDIVNGINYSEGGRVGVPGSSPVDVGTLNATFKNVASVPAVGDLVRLRRAGTTQYAFTGYVQDVSQRIIFDDSVSYTTPITLTTIYCVDWVGYISQFQAVGAGGNNPVGGAAETDSSYTWDYRTEALNRIIDATGATDLISYLKSVDSNSLGDTDLVGTFAEHLDLISNSTDAIWYGAHVLPTNKTTGRTGLVEVRTSPSALDSSGKTFTDEAGSAGQLHYTEIDFENSTQNVANTVTVRNRVRFWVPDSEVTRIGGFNEENYMVVNNQNVVGVAVDSTQTKTDATSINTYGIRQTEIETNVTNLTYGLGSFNLIFNPSAEYSDDGYSGGTTNKVRRRKPSEDANPFNAYSGEWAMRSRTTTATPLHGINYSGGESDGIPVVFPGSYYVTAYVARGTISRTDVRARIDVNWYNESEALISTLAGTYVSLTTANTWYRTPSLAYTAPAGAVRATINIIFNRSGGGNHTVGDLLWADAVQFSKFNYAYHDGDTPWDATYGYIWTGGVGASPSYKVQNIVDDAAADLLARYSTTSMRISRIRWNAQEDLTAVSSLSVGKTVNVRYDGATTQYRIVGIDGSIDPERYMIDYYLAKV